MPRLNERCGFLHFFAMLGFEPAGDDGVSEQGDLNAISGRAESALASPNYASVTGVFCVQVPEQSCRDRPRKSVMGHEPYRRRLLLSTSRATRK